MQGQQFSSPRSLRKEAKLAPRETVQLSFSLNGLKDRFAAGFKSRLVFGEYRLHFKLASEGAKIELNCINKIELGLFLFIWLIGRVH